jgi:hypothetical protein
MYFLLRLLLLLSLARRLLLFIWVGELWSILLFFRVFLLRLLSFLVLLRLWSSYRFFKSLVFFTMGWFFILVI